MKNPDTKTEIGDMYTIETRYGDLHTLNLNHVVHILCPNQADARFTVAKLYFSDGTSIEVILNNDEWDRLSHTLEQWRG